MQKVLAIIAAYIASAFAVGAVASILIALFVDNGSPAPAPVEVLYGAIFLGVMAAALALPFGIVTVGLGWWRGITNPFYYAGMAVAAAAFALVVFGGADSLQRTGDWLVVAGTLVAAAIGGLVFWGLAGRHLGKV